MRPRKTGGKFLSDFPDICKEIDFSIHTDIDINSIVAGGGTIINWICKYCHNTYKKSVDKRIGDDLMCPNRNCITMRKLEKIKENNKNDVIKPVDEIKRRIVPEQSKNDVEIWKELPEELNLSRYEVSSLGNLRNKDTKYVHSNTSNNNAYIRKTLYKDDNSKERFAIHILVAMTFIPNPENKPTVNHINSNRIDNRVINLEWATRSEQSLKTNRKIIKKMVGKSVNQYDLTGKFIKTWDRIIDASRELNIFRGHITGAAKGRHNSAGGFIWEYVNLETFIEGEIWKDCPLGEDFEKVLASNLGRIKVGNKDPTYGSTKNGYYKITIYNITIKRHKSFFVHRLIALTFLDNPENKQIVNHIDENPSNNNIDNLNYMTQKENVNYSLDRNNRYKKDHRSKIIVQIDKETKEIINKFNSFSHAFRETGIDGYCISKCCNNKSISAGGYFWEFASQPNSLPASVELQLT